MLVEPLGKGSKVNQVDVVNARNFLHDRAGHSQYGPPSSATQLRNADAEAFAALVERAVGSKEILRSIHEPRPGRPGRSGRRNHATLSNASCDSTAKSSTGYRTSDLACKIQAAALVHLGVRLTTKNCCEPKRQRITKPCSKIGRRTKWINLPRRRGA